jgi:hypothetical protein
MAGNFQFDFRSGQSSERGLKIDLATPAICSISCNKAKG